MTSSYSVNSPVTPFWSVPVESLFASLKCRPEGLTHQEAEERLLHYGPNKLADRKPLGDLALFLGQFKSPIILMLLIAAGLSLFVHDPTDASIILGIVLISGGLGFWQERGAARAVKRLLAMVEVKATVLEDGQPVELAADLVVPGDILILAAGDIIPADCRLLEAKDLHVDEATLTGETYPVEKSPGMLAVETPLARRHNVLFMGTHVVSGSGRALVVRTGANTEFGEISKRLRLRPPETEFEHGVRRFGMLLLELTLVLAIVIFVLNVYLKRPVIDSFLFSLALAVGLTPQLLPAIISVNLAHGARRMAEQKVIVKRLASIENFGSMNVLCSDKTGTLTQGTVELHAALDTEGEESRKVLLYGHLNACFETGFVNPLDQALRTQAQFDVSGYRKLDEVPYDFVRKRLSIMVERDRERVMITKGALENVLAVCSQTELPDGRMLSLSALEPLLQERFRDYSAQGFRVLGLSYRYLQLDAPITKDDERDMTFLGFLLFTDPLKPGIVETIEALQDLGIVLKVITGDHHFVAAHVCRQMGLADPHILTGQALQHMSDEALVRRAGEVNAFAEVEPNQKERIILALRKSGKVVGYLGDGINDASALHAADVGLSVEGGVDVAKEAADIVLLEKDLRVLVDGVYEGRRTFANTLKYVFMATSANFGNMFSMAGASLFLPFLPLLPKQVLLTNLLTDLPEMTIAYDSVDGELIDRPRRWDIRFIRRFMVIFGLLSSVFDYFTFFVLLAVLGAGPGEFRTGWFIESVISASLIVLVIRSRRPFFRSRPSRYLLLATGLVVITTLFLPFVAPLRLLGFQPLPPEFLLMLGGIVVLYIAAAEAVKQRFYRKWSA